MKGWQTEVLNFVRVNAYALLPNHIAPAQIRLLASPFDAQCHKPVGAIVPSSPLGVVVDI